MLYVGRLHRTRVRHMRHARLEAGKFAQHMWGKLHNERQTAVVFTCIRGHMRAQCTRVLRCGLHTKKFSWSSLRGAPKRRRVRPARPHQERGRGRAPIRLHYPFITRAELCCMASGWRAELRRVGRQAVLVQGGALSCRGLVFRSDRPRAQRVDGRRRRRRRFSDARHVCRLGGEGTSSGRE